MKLRSRGEKASRGLRDAGWGECAGAGEKPEAAACGVTKDPPGQARAPRPGDARPKRREGHWDGRKRRWQAGVLFLISMS